ncbi:dimethyladenosine transferase, partial [mine drainage metagenome]
REALPRVAPAALEQVVRAAFGQRRKTLGNALRDVLDADAIRVCGIDPQLRAERLAPVDFVRLAQQFVAVRAASVL